MGITRSMTVNKEDLKTGNKIPIIIGGQKLGEGKLICRVGAPGSPSKFLGFHYINEVWKVTFEHDLSLMEIIFNYVNIENDN